MREGIFICPTH